MALPRQIQKHADELAQLEKLMKEAAQPVVDKKDDGTPPEPVEEKATDDKPGDEQVANQAPDNVVTLEQPEPKASDNQQAPAEKEQTTDATSENWEQKYKHLQGKYNAEVPRLHSEVKELRGMIQQLQAQPAQPAPIEQPPAKQEPEKFVTDQDVDAFGEDLIDLQRRVAREVATDFKAELEKLREQNQQLQQRMSSVQELSFEERLTREIPDFQALNQDQRWIDWLNEFDPLLRGPRRNMAQSAYMDGDLAGVKAYVEQFKAATGQVEQQPQQSRPTAKHQAELERQVQPPRAATPPSSRSQKKVYSMAEADKAYATMASLLSKGKHEEASAIEAEISAAYAEGRVSG